MNNISLVILSCDKYSECWNPFFLLLSKYWKNYPKVYLVTETKKCRYSETININNECWTHRFREALKKISEDYVIVMLEDFFIRQEVDINRIEYCLSQMKDDVAVFNFEKKHRQCEACDLIGFEKQFNNQFFLNSCQPSLWNKKVLIERLQDDINAWDWEMIRINDNRLHYINTQDFIIDIGYHGHTPWGITQGKWTNECIEFLKKENIYINFEERGIL